MQQLVAGDVKNIFHSRDVNVYVVLAEILVVKVACYKLLRKLVSNRKKEGRVICCGLG